MFLEVIENLFADLLPQEINDDYRSCVSAPIEITDTQHISGFVYIVSRGHGLLITPAMNTYFISIVFITSHNLYTGDHIEAMINEEGVIEIGTHTPNLFARSKAIRPHRNLPCNTMCCGDRAIIKTNHNFDFAGYIVQYKKTHKDVLIHTLLLDACDATVEYLCNNDIHKVFATKVNQNIKKKVLLALNCLFTAKQEVSMGKDVVLFIDNLTKLFRIYNATVTDDMLTSYNTLNHGCLNDLKEFFMKARQIQNGGSLTIVFNLKPSDNGIEQFVEREFISLASVFLTE